MKGVRAPDALRRGLPVCLAAAIALIALWPGRRDTTPSNVPEAEQPAGLRRAARPQPAPDIEPGRTGWQAPGARELHAALGEEFLRLPSELAISPIEVERPRVCAGEPVQMAAEIIGDSAGAVSRWAWMTPGGGAEIHPGTAFQWTAPAVPGRYPVHFQVCKDLGGRRVGVLAERMVTMEVGACKGAETDAQSLRILVSQRGPATFAFRAELAGEASATEHIWDFGDGTTLSTELSEVEHAYLTRDLGPRDVATFTVKLRTRTGPGELLQAMAFARVRGQPGASEPPAVDIHVSRWRQRPGSAGWQSDISVQNPENREIVWDHALRVTKYLDDRIDMDTRPWTEVVAVDELLAGGGFRGRVLVDAAEVPADVKQITDFLHGHDLAGEEVVVSWTPFKRAPLPSHSGSAGALPPEK